jgi:hypothetical protein
VWDFNVDEVDVVSQDNGGESSELILSSPGDEVGEAA